jgi:hypothetical protein
MDQFPSKDHETSLNARVRDGGYSALTNTDKAHYHAYVYAWRRQCLEQHDRSSPLDSQGEYFTQWMVDMAQAALYRVNPRQYVTPADVLEAEGETDRAARYRAQDRVRAAALATIADEKLPDGSWSPESQAFIGLCAEQARSNLREFLQGSRAGFLTAQDRLRELQRALGVQAVEMGEPSMVDDVDRPPHVEPPPMSPAAKEQIREQSIARAEASGRKILSDEEAF